jgi:hypothetical protein
VIDGWDWVWLYYLGTVVLGMTPEQFWKTSPRKLDALYDKHLEINGMDDEEEDFAPEQDQENAVRSVMSW